MKRAVVMLLLLSGCAAAPDPRLRDPTPAEWQAADFGDTPAYYDTAIRTYMEDVLREPSAATLTIKAGPKKTWIGEAPNFQYGYGVCVEIDERGVYTAYTNFGPTFVFLFNGTVVQMRQGSDGERLCARLGRAPAGENAN